MLPLFIFTKEDSALIKGQSVRDPLGTQMLWSAMGRKIVPHLTEQTNSVLGFQLLISSFFFHEKFISHLDRTYDKKKNDLKYYNKKDIFSLENTFLLLERIFAFSYYKIKGDWPLNGKRQVVARNNDSAISLNNPILQSQQSTGVWGYYRGAAIRAGLLEESGRFITDNVRNDLSKDIFHKIISREAILEFIYETLKDGKDYDNKSGKMFASILCELPQKKLLRKYLLEPKNNSNIKILAEFAVKRKLKGSDEKTWRQFFNSCRTEFPSMEEHFINIIRTTDYIGSLDWIFEWLLSFKGEKLLSASNMLPVRFLDSLKNAHEEFCKINTFESYIKKRSNVFIENINLDSKIEFLRSLISLHDKIAEERKNIRWIRLSDEERVITETDSFIQQKQDPQVTPGQGWRYDYYLTPLINIYEGVI